MAISEELELDITGALDAIESLNEPLTALGENLTLTLTSAIEAVDVQPLADQLAAIDAAGLTTTIDASIDAVDGTVPIEADTEAVPGEIDASIASADTTVVLDASTEGFGGSIDEALLAADATVAVDADASGITGEIDAAIDAADTTVEVDTGDTGEGLEGLGEDADTASSKIGGIGTASSLAADAATGNFAAIGGAIGKTAGPVGLVGTAIAGVAGVLVAAGTTAQAAFDRARVSIGKFRRDVDTINVGTLNTDIGKIAAKLGSTESALLDANTTLFTFQKQSGQSGEASAEFANNVTALAARAVALNPKLGSVEDVALAMQKSFAKGGKGAAAFGIDLAKADIEARALANTGKASVADLTAQEKALAAAQLGAEKYGKGIKTDINEGSKNAAIQQRQVTASLTEFIQTAGRPLVAPFQRLLKDLVPIVKELLPIFAELAQTLLPVLTDVVGDVVVPIAKLAAAGGELIAKIPPEVLKAIAAAFLLFKGVKFASGVAQSIGEVGTKFFDATGKMKDFFTAGGGFDGFRLQAIGAKDRIVDIATAFKDLIKQLATKVVAKIETKLAVSGAAGAGEATASGFTSFLATKLGLAKAAGAGALFVATLPVTIGIATLAVVLLNQDAIKNSPISEKLGDIFYDLGQGIVGDLISGFTDGINSGFTALGQFLVEFIPNSIITPIKNALGIGSPSTVFFGIGVDIILGLLGGLASLVPTVLQFFGGLPARILTAVGNVASGARSLVQKGIDLIGGLLSGLGQKFGEVLNFVGSIPGRIVRGIPNVARILFDAGKRIIGGLIDGMVKGLGPLGSFLKGVGGFIKDHKPIATDHLLLRPAGEAIMQGLTSSIEDSIPSLETALQKVSDTIADTKMEGTAFIPAALPIPGISKLPAVAAALPVSAGPAAAVTAGPVTSAQADLQGVGAGIHIGQLVVQTAAKDQTQVGIEVSRQLRAESFRAGR